MFIGIFDHSSINTFVLDDKAWLAVSSLAHIPKVFRLRSGNYAGQVGPSTPNLSSMSLWTWLCKLVYSHVGTGRGYPQLFHKALYTIELCCGLAGSVSGSLLHRLIQLFWHLDWYSAVKSICPLADLFTLAYLLPSRFSTDAPQETVLTPCLFTIYTTDFSQVCLHTIVTHKINLALF